MAEASRSGRTARLTDVAQAAGVGTSIASRVLNGDPTVSIRLETRERILDAARELNYRPNAMARGLRLARTMSLGIIINLAYYYENAEILAAVESAAASAGYVTLIADTADFVSRGEAYRRLLFERRVDGLLIASVFVPDEFIHELREESLPFVLINRRVAGIGPCATVDDEFGMRMAVDISWVSAIAGSATSPGRRTRSRQPAPGRVPVRDPSGRAPCPRAARPPLPGRRRERSLRYGTAARGRAAPDGDRGLEPDRRCSSAGRSPSPGIRVPEHMSVIAYNDSPIAGYLEPPLTTVHMPLAEMARGGVDCLLETIDGGEPRSFVVRTPPTLVQRESTAPAPSAAWTFAEDRLGRWPARKRFSSHSAHPYV